MYGVDDGPRLIYVIYAGLYFRCCFTGSEFSSWIDYSKKIMFVRI